jgi:hypothetical protein
MSEDISAAIEWANEYGPGASVNNYPAVLVKALTESRREVEEAKDFVYKMNPSPMYVMTALAELVEHRKHQFASGLNIYAWKEKAERLEAENATLRQEVERLDKALDKYRASKTGWAWQSLDDWEKAVQARLEPLRRQVEEQAAKLRRLADHTPDAHSGQCAILKAADPARPCGCGALDDLFPLEVLRRAERAESSLAAAQERIKELSNLSPFIKQIQRVEAERDAALSRAEAVEKALRRAMAVIAVPIPIMDSALLNKAYEDILAALAAPSEPKEGGDCQRRVPCDCPAKDHSDCVKTICGRALPCEVHAAPTPSAGEEPWKCPGLASGGPGKCSREKPCFYCNPKFQAGRP